MIGLSFIVVTALGQRKEKIHFGIKGGGYTTFYNGENYDSKHYGYKIGSTTNFHAGVFVEFPLSRRLFLQPEIVYYKGGYIVSAPTRLSDTIFYDFDQRLGYVSIPVLLKYRLKGFAVYAGAQLDYLFSAKESIDHSDNYFSVRDQYEEQSISAIGGLEYTFRFGLGASIRYQLGLINIGKPKELGQGQGIYSEDANMKAAGLFYGIHWRFGKLRNK